MHVSALGDKLSLGEDHGTLVEEVYAEDINYMS